MANPLSARTLASVADRLPTPAYDRSRVSSSVVHFGVGGFHRAHQAMYHDRLMNRGKALDWGICGVGVMAADRRMKEALDAQDGLYTLVVKHSDGTLEPRVIGSIVEYLFAPDGTEAVIEKIADDSTRVVSLTVTEGGYNIDHVTGEFNSANPEVLGDLRPGAPPRTTFGLVTEALRRRKERRLPAFTVMSCDNLQGNGHLAGRVFTAFARLRDPELGDWIEREVRFPNSMVDRITPVTTDADRALVSERFGIEDRWPVVCEPFTQWVLEDSFGAGRRRRRSVRADEAALAQREPPGTGLLRSPVRVPAGARGGAGPVVPEVPAGLHERGGDPHARPGAGSGPRRLQGHPDRALLQPRGARHDRPAVRGELGPHPEVVAAGHPRAARQRRRAEALGGGGRELGPVRRGGRRAGPTHRGGRPAQGQPDADRPAQPRGSRRLHREPRGLRGPRRRQEVRPRIPLRLDLAARTGGTSHPRVVGLRSARATRRVGPAALAGAKPPDGRRVTPLRDPPGWIVGRACLPAPLRSSRAVGCSDARVMGAPAGESGRGSCLRQSEWSAWTVRTSSGGCWGPRT